MVSSKQVRGRTGAISKRESSKAVLPVRWILVTLAVTCAVLAGLIRFEQVQADGPAASTQQSLSGSQDSASKLPSASESAYEYRRWQQVVRSRTSGVQEQIEEGLDFEWDEETLNLHQVTTRKLVAAWRRLGMFESAKQLDQEVRTQKKKYGQKVTRENKAYLRTELMSQGKYAEALATLDPQSSSAAPSLHSILLSIIRMGDLQLAEEMIQQFMRAKGEKGYRGNMRGTLLQANGELAAAAHWLDQPEFILPAMQRHRAIVTNSDTISQRPLDEDLGWIHKDQWGPHFVLSLASCGMGEMAADIWQSEKMHGKDRREVPLWTLNEFSTIDLCKRLAHNGKRDLALRVAREHFDGVVYAEVFHTLTQRAIDDDNLELADQPTDEFLSAVRELSFIFHGVSVQRGKPTSKAVLQTLQMGTAASLLKTFISDMQNAGQSDLGRRAALVYIEMAEQFADQFESNMKVKDVNLLRAHRRNEYPFTLEAVVEVLPDGPLDEFIDQQNKFIARNRAYFEHDMTMLTGRASDHNILALAKIGREPSPNRAKGLSTKHKKEAIERLVDAGNLEGALPILQALLDDARRVGSVSFVSGSTGGRVVNGAIRNRYWAAELATRCGQLETAIEIVNLIEHPGQRLDGYRVLAVAYSRSTDLETAFRWAKGLSDPHLRLAACVGILEAQTDVPLVVENELADYLNRLERMGTPFFMWGC